jgi:hypothetical protein
MPWIGAVGDFECGAERERRGGRETIFRILQGEKIVSSRIFWQRNEA